MFGGHFVAVVGVTLITCLCGVPGTFTELPYDTREHLIAYHTEGQGEDKVNTSALLRLFLFLFFSSQNSVYHLYYLLS